MPLKRDAFIPSRFSAPLIDLMKASRGRARASSSTTRYSLELAPATRRPGEHAARRAGLREGKCTGRP